MVMTKEERAAYDKVYKEKNKEKIRAQDRARYQRDKEKNKEKRRAQRKARYEKNKESEIAQRKARYEKNKESEIAQNKAWSKTPIGMKSKTLTSWKRQGLIGDLSKIYDERYLHCTHCEVCTKEFSSKSDRCLDHDHETGLFRKVLCRNCNSMDNWKKYI